MILSRMVTWSRLCTWEKHASNKRIYISMTRNFITWASNSSKHVYALCLRKNIAKKPLNAHTYLSRSAQSIFVFCYKWKGRQCLKACFCSKPSCMLAINALILPTDGEKQNIGFRVYDFGCSYVSSYTCSMGLKEVMWCLMKCSQKHFITS